MGKRKKARFAKHRREFTMRTCDCCGREYRTHPVGKKSYSGTCPHCGCEHDIFGNIARIRKHESEADQ